MIIIGFSEGYGNGDSYNDDNDDDNRDDHNDDNNNDNDNNKNNNNNAIPIGEILYCRGVSSICNITRINSSPPSAAYMRQWMGSALVQIMACCLFGTNPSSKPMLDYCWLHP